MNDITTDAAQLTQAVSAEVGELHQFFEDRFTARLQQNEEHFRRVTSALDPTFVLISPDGALADYATVIAWLRSGYGSRPSFRLWTDQITLRHIADDLALVTYEKWQEIAGVVNGRLSSALFRLKTAAPHGVTWLHVHETRLPLPASVE